MTIKTLPSGIHELTLRLDDLDRRSIEQAMSQRDNGILPDPVHDDANEAGMLIAEICRGWMERCEAMERNRKELDEFTHYRKCHACGNVARHADNVAPYVDCRQCGSRDTRKVK